ncbi:MAG: alpha-amylase family glycosyl hydrolase [Acidobacteriota bacterium]
MRLALLYAMAALLAAPICCIPRPAESQASRAPIEKPQIEKIDPPGWWAGLPSPMLLVRGHGFAGAHFAVTGGGVSLARTQISANGHWAFLWLDAADAAPQTLSIAVENAHGQARCPYVLAQRTNQAHAHAGFSPADAMYLVMTDRFARGESAGDPAGDDRAAARGWHGGNFAGIAAHIGYLKQLGITTLWTTPIFSNAGMAESYHGYAATDLYAVDPHFGTLAEYRHLSDALHAQGLKLVIDLAPNHIGIAHPWVKDPPAPDWLHGTAAHHLPVSADFAELIDPHAPPQAWRNIISGWFTDAMPDLNQSNPLVARYLIQNAIWWVETAHLDGIRLDTFPYVDRAYWHEFDATLHGVYPHLTMVGEIFNRDPEVTSFFAGGEARTGADGRYDTGLDTPFDFPVYFALRDVLTQGKPMTELERVLAQDALYPHPARLVTFLGNHDTSRFLTDAGGDDRKLELALGLLATLRGMPLVYAGDEIGMTGGGDPNNRHDFPGGFAGDPHDAFTQTGRSGEQQEIFEWTSRLLNYRATRPALKAGIEQDLFADAHAFAFVRAERDGGCAPDRAGERLLVVVNDGAESETVKLNLEQTALNGCTEFQLEPAGSPAALKLRGGQLQIVEPAESLSILSAR